MGCQECMPGSHTTCSGSETTWEGEHVLLSSNRKIFSMYNITYEESLRRPASGLRNCHLLLGWYINMLVLELVHVGANWLCPFVVICQIYGCSNVGHNLCLWEEFMAKIWAAIKYVWNHQKRDNSSSQMLVPGVTPHMSAKQTCRSWCCVSVS